MPHYESTLKMTVEAFYEITVREIKRLERLAEANRLDVGEHKRMRGAEARYHQQLMRYMRIKRLQESGLSYNEIAAVFSVSRQAVHQRITKGEPAVPWHRSDRP